METFSYKKTLLLLAFLGLFSNPSYAWFDWFQSCEKKYDNNIAEALMNDDIDCAKELIHKEANIDAKNKSGYTALMTAILKQDKDTVSLLIEKNANPFITDYGVDAKAIAYWFSKEYLILIKMINKEKEILELKKKRRYYSAGKYIVQLKALEKELRALEDQLAVEFKDGLDFNDPVSEEIYNMLILHETSYRSEAPKNKKLK